MKTGISALIAAAVFASTGAIAQMKMDGMKRMEMASKPTAGAKQAPHTTTATVKKIDHKAGAVTLAHEPVPSLNWPAMTMNFKVKDNALWSKLAEGKKVDVEFAQEGNDYVLVKVK